MTMRRVRFRKCLLIGSAIAFVFSIAAAIATAQTPMQSPGCQGRGSRVRVGPFGRPREIQLAPGERFTYRGGPLGLWRRYSVNGR